MQQLLCKSLSRCRMKQRAIYSNRFLPCHIWFWLRQHIQCEWMAAFFSLQLLQAGNDLSSSGYLFLLLLLMFFSAICSQDWPEIRLNLVLSRFTTFSSKGVFYLRHISNVSIYNHLKQNLYFVHLSVRMCYYFWLESFTFYPVNFGNCLFIQTFS